MNVNELLFARKDTGSRKPDLILPDVFQYVNAEEWLNTEGRNAFFRMVAQSDRTGRFHDVSGRQGVYASAQEGPVAGIGRPMKLEGRRFGIFTPTKRKVNVGAGKGYRGWLYSLVVLFAIERKVGNDTQLQVLVTPFGSKVIVDAIRARGGR